MWAVTPQFLEALRYPHRIRTTLTITAPGGAPETINIKAGTISVDGNSRVRRRATLTLEGDSSVYETLATPGTLFEISHGIVLGRNNTEMIPVFAGELLDGSQTFGDGTISITLVDHANWLARTRYVTPYAPTSATARTTAITALVEAAKPGTSVTNESSDTGTIGSSQVWTEGPLDTISDLARDGGTEAYFQPDGTFLIRDLRTLTSPSVWTAGSGDAGVIISAERVRSMDRLYNTVVVRPATTDGSQTWAQQVAAITDTADPRHPDHIGTVPYFWASPTAATAGAALAAAERILDRVKGSYETLTLGMITNPALEANEPIRVITPKINTQPALIFQHFIDSFTLDLVTGASTMSTRSQVATDE